MHRRRYGRGRPVRDRVAAPHPPGSRRPAPPGVECRGDARGDTVFFGCDREALDREYDTLGLTAELARRNSPVHLVPAAAGPLLLPVGALEGDEYHRQTESLAAAWRRRGLAAEVMDMAGHDHFSIITALADPGTPLSRAILDQMGLSAPEPATG